MSDEQGRPDSQKSRQELLDEIYYLRDVAGEREQRAQRAEAQLAEMRTKLDLVLHSRSWRLTTPLRWLTRVARSAEPKKADEPKRQSSGRGSLHQLRAILPSSTAESRADDSRYLYVDVTALALHGGMTGVQRVTREIAMALLEAPPGSFIVRPVYAAEEQPYRVAKGFSIALGIGDAGDEDALIDPRAGDIFLGLDHSLHAVVERERDLHTMRRQGVRVWFVCNDTLPLDHPEWFPPDVSPGFEAWLRAVLRTADGVACISRTTQAALVRWIDVWKIERDRPLALGHFGLGASPGIHIAEPQTISEEESALLARTHGKPTFLMVGTLEPRKSHAQALEAFNQLWANGEDAVLMIAGLPGWMTEITQRRIRHHDEFGRRLFWFVGPNDALLEKLYATCTVLLAPSEGEGFGLPLVEAAKHGLPILCRDLPVFREVAGEFATYFSGNDPESLAQAIKQWREAQRRDRVSSTGTMPSLTWAESARQLLGVVIDGCNEVVLAKASKDPSRNEKPC